MAKVNVGRQGFITKSALPVVTRQRGTTNVPLTALINANQTTDNTSNTNPVDSSTHNLRVDYYAGYVSQTQSTPFAAGTGGSFVFDGVGDFLQVSGTNTQLQFGTGDFTMEAWVWLPSVSTNMAIFDFRSPSNGSQPVLYYRAPYFAYYTLSGDRIIGNTTIVANTWYHVALVRISGTTRMYVNGVQQTATYADTGNYVILADRPVIGQLSDNAPLLNSWSNNNTLRGFISNVRVVKGIGVYTGNFTVPTSPLTATQSAGTNIAAISGTETSLLLNGTNYRVVDSSTNNPKGLSPFGVSFTPSGGQVNFHPYSGSGRYGSYWFDGGYSYIDSPDNADWVLTGDFTIEAWIYPTALGFRRIISQLQAGSNTNTSWSLGINGSNNILWEVYQGSSSVSITSSVTISANTWTHVAISRSGTSQTLYINGVSRGTGPLTGSSNNSTYPLRIGAEASNSIPANRVAGLVPSTTVGGAALVFPGYITGVRVVSGTAVYTGAFTPPSIQPVDVDGASSAASYPSTTNVDVSFSSTDTKLLCKFDRWTLQDNDTLPRPMYLNGTAQTSTAQAKFGAASLTATTPANAIVYGASDASNFGTGDFTIQCWVYVTSFATDNQLWCTVPANGVLGGSTTAAFANINTSGQLLIYRPNVAGYLLNSQSTGAWLNQWNHIAIVRRSGVVTGYINGVGGTPINNFNGINVNGLGYTIGSAMPVVTSPQTAAFAGFIDDFNITNTAMYVSNFTPPTTQATDPYVAPNIISNSVYGAYQNY